MKKSDQGKEEKAPRHSSVVIPKDSSVSAAHGSHVFQPRRPTLEDRIFYLLNQFEDAQPPDLNYHIDKKRSLTQFLAAELAKEQL